MSPDSAPPIPAPHKISLPAALHPLAKIFPAPRNTLDPSKAAAAGSHSQAFGKTATFAPRQPDIPATDHPPTRSTSARVAHPLEREAAAPGPASSANHLE